MLIDIYLDNHSTFLERTRYSFNTGEITLHKNKLFYTSASFLYKNSRYHIIHPLILMNKHLYIDTFPDFVRKKDKSYIHVEAYRINGHEKHIFDGYERLFNFLFEDTCCFTKNISRSFIVFLLEMSYKPLFKVTIDSSNDSYTFTLLNNLLLVSDITFTSEEIRVRNSRLYSMSRKRCLYEFMANEITIKRDKVFLDKNPKVLLNQILQAEVSNIPR